MDFGKLWRTGPAPVSASLGGYDPVGYRSPALSQGMFGGILSKLNPFPEGLDPNERSARSDALIQLGLGILQGNTGHYGAAMPAIAAGGIAGFQGYKNALKEQGDRRLRLLQEKLVGSQIAENDSQALARTNKEKESQRLLQARQKIIADMDAEFGGYSSERNSLYDSGLPPGEGNQVTAPGIAVRPTYWAATPEGNQTAAIRLMQVGAMDAAKEFMDRAKELKDAQLREAQLNKEKQPPATIDVPVGQNVKRYMFAPDSKGADRLPQDPRYVFLGEGQGGGVRVSVDAGTKVEGKYGEVFGGKVGEADFNLLESARKAPEMAETANTVMKLLREGKPITGWGANFRQGFASAAAAAGIKDESVADSQQLGQMLAATTMAAIKSSGLGAGQGFTNTDREFLEKAAAGQVTFDEKSLFRAAQLNYKAAKRATDKWKSRYDMMPKSAREGTNVERDIPIPPAYSFAPKEQPKAAPPAGAPRVLRFDKNGNLIR